MTVLPTDPTVIRIMKMRKRHVRLALARHEAIKKKTSIQPCPVCRADAEANYDAKGGYHGHHCPNGHGFVVAKKIREPHADRPQVEKADVAHMPLRPSANTGMSMQQQKVLQNFVETKFPNTAGWKEQDWKLRRVS